MRTMTQEAWHARGTELYGENPNHWKFRCPACGHVQSMQGMLDRNPDLKPGDIEGRVYFSCEGRLTEGVGCDWSLGGLLKMHALEVFDADGVKHNIFEFADDPVGESQKHWKQAAEVAG